MRVALLPYVLPIAGAAAQHVNYEIPWVNSVVQSMTQRFGDWAHYHGPTHSYSFPKPTHTPSPSPGACADYWLEDIKHQGISAFNPDPGYQVFRNVKDFGAKGDGVTDDTAAINSAISSGGRCAPGVCQSSTITPAIVYFPPGTYLVSSSIIDYYYTQIIGHPTCLPTLKANATFSGFGIIDGDPYLANGKAWGSTNVFFRQVRNFIFDMTGVPAASAMTGIHWPTAQATSLQNIVFKMPDVPGTQHQAVFIEEGSGGFMNDLVFQGGLYGLNVGNQQFTMRNLTFNGCNTAINQLWDWGWTYKGVNINNCSVGLNMSANAVGSVTLIDSSISNTPVGIVTSYNPTSTSPTAGSLIIENVALNNVQTAIQGSSGTVLVGTTGSVVIAAWGEGHAYQPNGPTEFEGPIAPNRRPAALTTGSKYYERSKPQYETVPAGGFLSVRDAGAKGDGKTDDTTALQRAILTAAATGKIIFIDAGTYLITKTLYIPHGSKLVGETYPVLMSSGKFFANIKSPQPVIQVGLPGEVGSVEWSDCIVSTRGAQAGAILIEWNLASPSGSPSGMWDVHTRIGGFAGTNLQAAQCPTTPTVATPPAPLNPNCIAAFMSMHVTKPATGLYMENNWLWTADHDLDDPANANTQITVYTGRGLYVESARGVLWLVGTAAEHHALYQYQLADTRSLFLGYAQTETPYYQPNPDAPSPFPPVAAYNDPTFPYHGASGVNNADAYGLRILRSTDVLAYSVGLYSFFDNYSTACSTVAAGETCQSRILSVEASTGVSVYNLNTVGTQGMITVDGRDVAVWSDNQDAFTQTVALFRTG